MSSKRYYPHNTSRVLPLLGLLGLTACTWIVTLVAPAVPTSDDHFAYVCYKLEQMYDVPCGELQAPIIVYSVIINDASGRWQTWHGIYYHGEPYIFINPDSDEDVDKIILHETGHYIIYELDLPPKGDTCEGERVVRLISGGEWGEEQRASYSCPADEKE